jgi:hypothetical protein
MAIGESSSMAAERREISASSAFEAKNFPVGMRVVAVDDDQICLAMLKKLLSKCEYKGLISSFLLFPFFFQFQVEVSFFFYFKWSFVRFKFEEWFDFLCSFFSENCNFE